MIMNIPTEFEHKSCTKRQGGFFRGLETKRSPRHVILNKMYLAYCQLWLALSVVIRIMTRHKKWSFLQRIFSVNVSDQIRRKLTYAGNLLKKSSIKNFIFCAVWLTRLPYLSSFPLDFWLINSWCPIKLIKS